MRNRSVSVVLLCILVLILMVSSNLAAFAANEEQAKPSVPDTLTMDIRNADIRDVLSAIALNMECTVIYTAEPILIDFQIKDVTPATAMEYVLNKIGMEYIRSGNTIIVGTRESLTEDFFTSFALTRFSLKYIPSDIIASQIDSLGIQVQKITLESNQKNIWVQGLPQDLGKVRELIAMLDRAENGSIVPSSGSYNLSPLALTYITAQQFNDLLVEIGMTPGLILDSNPKTLYVYASSEEYKQIDELKKKIDIAENQQGSEFVVAIKRLKYIKASEAEPIIRQFGLNVDVITFTRTVQSLWLKGDEETIKQVTALIDQIDIQQNIEDNVFYVHKLSNISALEADTRLKLLEIPEIKTYTFGYPQFSKSILVVCPADYRAVVGNHLNRMDIVTDKIRVPIDFSDDPAGTSRLTARRDILVTLTGIPATSFTISQNIARGEPIDTGYHYVLILEETPEKIKMVEDMITKLDTPLDNEYEPAN